MKYRRVLLVLHEELVPPARMEDIPEKDFYAVQMEYDVLTHLREMGHTVEVVGVRDELRPIRTLLESFEPHVVFNLLGHFQGITVYDAYVVSWLELRHVPYTGCNPRGLLLSSDKALSKKILNFHRIPTPPFLIMRRGRKTKLPSKLEYPLFVKSAAEHASIGISQASIVTHEESLRERITYIHDRIGTDALVERYVEGRELYVGVLGNDRLTTLPIWELTFKNLPRGSAAIATSRVKWDVEYQDKVGVHQGPAEDLDPALARSLSHIARRVYRALGLSGYARIDFRVDAAGGIWVLEANSNPDLSQPEILSESAAAAGMPYPELLRRILHLGATYAPAWKTE